MRNTIPVNVVVTDGVGGTYPGDLVDIELLCEGGKVSVEPGFLVEIPGPGWQFYTVAEFFTAFPGANTGGLPYHPGTLISCNGDTPWSYGVSNPWEDIFYTIDTCCGVSYGDGPFVFKQSLYPLTPGEPVPCGAEAIFKWLALVHPTDPSFPWISHDFSATLRSADSLIEISGNIVAGGPAETTQMVKKWPDDFIGLTLGGKTLVANNVTPGVDEYNVGAFDGGEIDVVVNMNHAFEGSESASQTFALPATQCDDESASFSGSTSESSEGETPCAAGDPVDTDEIVATAETPFNKTMNIVGGNAPFVYLPGSSNVPAWMTVSIVGSQIILGGTPAVGDVVVGFPLSIVWSACDGEAQGSYEPNLEVVEIGFLFGTGTMDISDYPGEVESWYYGLRNRAGNFSSGAAYLARIQEIWDLSGSIFTSSVDKAAPGGTFDDLIPNNNFSVLSVWPDRPVTIADLLTGFNGPDFMSASIWNSVNYNPTRDKFEIVPLPGNLAGYAWLDQV